MDLGLRGKQALVAGASSGLGWAVAAALAREGARVALCSRSRARIDEAAARITEATGNADVLPLVCDVTDEVQIKEAVTDTVEQFGGLNLLVTNAGGPPSGYVEDFTTKDWHNALDLNLVSTINLCRHALPHLKQAAEQDGHARILMVTSVSAKQPIPNLYLSNVARAGVQGFAKSLAAEVGPSGVTVNTILPGYTRTDRLQDLSSSIAARTGQDIDAIEAGWAEGTMLKRLGEPDEFGAAAAFLLSAHAGYITGHALVIDGGQVRSLM